MHMHIHMYIHRHRHRHKHQHVKTHTLHTALRCITLRYTTLDDRLHYITLHHIRYVHPFVRFLSDWRLKI